MEKTDRNSPFMKKIEKICEEVFKKQKQKN